jgi:lysophospholipase L1-like esterase
MFKQLIFLLALLNIQIVLADELKVPAVGSHWVSSVKRNVFLDEGSAGPEELMTVVRHEKGIPVFASNPFGYKGEIIQTINGTVIYTNKCKESVPKEIFVAPKTPNQCGWHVCSAPPLGEVISRPMIVFSELYSCKPEIGVYTFTTIGKSEINGESVSIGKASIDFGFFKKVSWNSYVGERGEVFAQDTTKSTNYSKVEVSFVPYENEGKELLQPLFLRSFKSEEGKQCDVVAFGDSLTEGLGASQDESYPAVLSKLVGRDICNLGISGNTTTDAKERLSHILSLKPKAIFMSFGANDALKGVPPNITKSNLSYIIDVLNKAEVMMVFLGFEGLKIDKSNSALLSLSSIREAVEKDKGLIYLPEAFVGILDEAHMLSEDKLHPNAAGYKKLANKIHDEALGALQVLPGLAVK